MKKLIIVALLLIAGTTAFADSYSWQYSYDPYTGQYRKSEVYQHSGSAFTAPSTSRRDTYTSPYGGYQTNSYASPYGMNYNYSYYGY